MAQVSRAPKLVEIIAAVPEEFRARLLPRLRAKPVRTASGIAVVAVMSKPHRCPHIATTGNICVYCPGGPDSDFEYSTQSYTGYEPTSMRAIRARCGAGGASFPMASTLGGHAARARDWHSAFRHLNSRATEGAGSVSKCRIVGSHARVFSLWNVIERHVFEACRICCMCCFSRAWAPPMDTPRVIRTQPRSGSIFARVLQVSSIRAGARPGRPAAETGPRS